MYIGITLFLLLLSLWLLIPAGKELSLRPLAILDTGIMFIQARREGSKLHRTLFLDNTETSELEHQHNYERIHHALSHRIRLVKTLLRVLTFRFALHKRDILLRTRLLNHSCSSKQFSSSGNMTQIRILGTHCRSFFIVFYEIIEPRFS